MTRSCVCSTAGTTKTYYINNADIRYPSYRLETIFEHSSIFIWPTWSRWWKHHRSSSAYILRIAEWDMWERRERKSRNSHITPIYWYVDYALEPFLSACRPYYMLYYVVHTLKLNFFMAKSKIAPARTSTSVSSLWIWVAMSMQGDRLQLLYVCTYVSSNSSTRPPLLMLLETTFWSPSVHYEPSLCKITALQMRLLLVEGRGTILSLYRRLYKEREERKRMTARSSKVRAHPCIRVEACSRDRTMLRHRLSDPSATDRSVTHS